ncbi:MAG TPA: hypothetical protein VF602_05525 [Pedobacter sp.]
MTELTSDLIIKQKIEEVKAFADEIPGVVILRNLNDRSVVWMSDRSLNLLGVSLISLSCAEYHENSTKRMPKIMCQSFLK